MAQRLIAVVGPTASGKTALAVELAHRLNGEVVSCDSMQLYRRMEIGTAAPTAEEMQGVPHHMIGVIEPDTPFSCADYTAQAEECIRAIAERGRVPILCGGTGLYLDSLLHVSAFSAAEGTEEVRAALTDFAETHGTQALHDRLAAVDAESAAAIHPNNVRRVVRALEIYETTGVPKSEWDRRSLGAEPKYDARLIVLDFHDRQRLYRRIDQRVTQMLAAGLENEVRTLFEAGLLNPRTVAAQAIGYKEFLPYFAGESSLEEAAEQIRQSSRRYAKRQLTWFRRYHDALWLYPDEQGDTLQSVQNLATQAEFWIQENK